jgi:two-component system CheB/CheR fusion protein
MVDERGPESGEERQPDQGSDRLTQPVDAEQPPRLPFPVVGIGASAGGLEAVGELLDALPPDSGMAFVLVQHLPPEHNSLMAEILSRRTRMPVRQVEDGMAVEANHVYVIRPGHLLTIHDGRLRLGPRLGSPRAANRPIDDFYKSLAEEQRERAICVVMSGMGSNGTAGAQAVKAVGGLCVAQDPESAQFPSMPRHLIDAGYADHVCRPGEMPEVLLGYALHPYARGGREADAEAVLRREREHLREILAIVRTRTRHDYSGYKKPTLLRRIQRRMGLTRTGTVGDYARLLRQTPAEAAALADDLLIHVTGFFRDPDAWDALQRNVIAPLVEARESGAPVRAWVTACSSGEEAYTLAMLLAEESERAGKTLDIKVFATDLAERALAYARAGIYPGGIESEIVPERLERFFTRDDEVYRVRPELRDRVVFASQNVLQDPPFSRIDIATCRNLLIYLEPAIQQRVLALLHFGLREGGALFLGTAETVADADDLFEPVDKKARIFRRIGPTRHGAVEFPLPRHFPLADAGARGPRGGAVARVGPRRWDGARPPVDQLTQRALLDQHTPPAVTVDRDHRILYYHGDTRPYLEQLSGEPTRDLMLLARDGVRGPIRVALHRAAAQNARFTAPDGWVDHADGRRVRVAVTASPLAVERADDGEGPADWFVVSFAERGEVVAVPPDDADVTDDTRRLRDELRSTIEELQTSNEELKASNEEVMSINEELQSANEELETSKEEMQSLNEELTTVNSQLRAKMEEHQAASSDLASLLASTDLAVLFLDTGLRIRRYTPAVRDLVELIAGDVGRPLADLARKFDDPELDGDCRAVLERLIPVEREVWGAGDRHFLRRVTPYRTTDNRIGGAVVTFVDITRRRRAEEALRASEDRLRMALDAARMGIWTWDPAPDVHVRDANLNRLLGLEPTETARPLADFLARIHAADRGAVRAEIETAAREGRPLAVEFRVLWPDGTVRWLRDQGGTAGRSDGEYQLTGAVVDVTDRRVAEERLRLILESATDYAIFTIDTDRTVTSWSPGATAVLGWTEAEVVGQSADMLFTPEDRAAGAPQAEAGTARRGGRAADERWHLRKDGSRFFASGVLSRLGDDGAEGYVKVLRDLTDRKQVEDELRAARDELERRVAERTTELTAALESLEREMNRRADLARRLSTVQEDERRRVARDLHDTVGQTLTGLALSVAGVATAGPLPAAAVERLAQVQRLADALGRELHEVAVRLRPTALDDVGLNAAVRALIEEWAGRTRVPVDFQAAGGDGRFTPEVETALYRVTQEALTNVARHAGATRVSVVLGRRSGDAVAVIEDDGTGFDPDAPATPILGRRGGLGLAGMRERVELLGGTVEVESAPGRGTTVIARIPLGTGL